MLDIRWMRENREALAEAMRKLNDTDAPWEKALALDEERRDLLTKVEALRAERNTGSKQVGALMREKKAEEANALKGRMSTIGDEIAGDAEPGSGGDQGRPMNEMVERFDATPPTAQPLPALRGR